MKKTPGTVTNILSNLKWTPLETRRQNIRLSLLYKIVQNQVDISATPYLNPHTRQSRHYHHLAYQIPTTSVDYHKFSFFPRTVITWNALPTSVVSADTILGFKSALAAHVTP